VIEMLPRCRKCHEREYGGWLSSGHSASYSDIFLNDNHNEMEQPHDDCLRCHGMFFAGRSATSSLRSAQRPLEAPRGRTEGPSGHPLPGLPPDPPDGDSGRRARPLQSESNFLQAGVRSDPPRPVRPPERVYFDVTVLPLPKIRFAGRNIALATDARQRLCYQCHAPDATHETWTSDDRTPRGVHEG